MLFHCYTCNSLLVLITHLHILTRQSDLYVIHILNDSLDHITIYYIQKKVTMFQTCTKPYQYEYFRKYTL